MFQAWRLRLREARAALRGGRLDEACRLLKQGDEWIDLILPKYAAAVNGKYEGDERWRNWMPKDYQRSSVIDQPAYAKSLLKGAE